MRKAVIVVAGLFSVTSLYTPKEANAQLFGGGAVVCANCSTLAEELISDAKQALQYVTQLQQYATQLQQYFNMITNTISLPEQIFANVTGDVNEVRGIIKAASLLTGNSGSILQRLGATGAYANMTTMLPSQVGAQITMWQQTLANADKTLGNAFSSQHQMESGYASLQSQMQNLSLGAEGQKQAIQASIDASHIVATQLNQMQATLIAASQSAATRDIIAADRQAAEDAWFLNFAQYQPTGVSGQGF